MKIVILSEIDYAGSGFKMFQAIKRHTNHEIRMFSGTPQNKLNHPTSTLVTEDNRPHIQKNINDADIIHFKGDWPPLDGYLGLKIPDKPIIITTAGTFFRKKEHKGLGTYNHTDYHRATLKTSFETDLLYPEYSDVWTPHPIDSDDQPRLWQMNGKPVFMHIPSSPERKGTEFVNRVFSILEKSIDCETEIITGVTYQESIEAKKRATIYFDQFEVGFYGNAALEAMQWGIPVVCWISRMALNQAKGQLYACPIINEDKSNPENTASRVINIIKNSIEARSIITKGWCDKRHGYKAIAKQWDKLYTKLYDNANSVPSA